MSLLPPVGPKLTDEQIDAIVEWTRYNAKARRQMLGENYHEADYVTGVLTTLFALDRADKIPASWIIGPLTGRPVFEEATT